MSKALGGDLVHIATPLLLGAAIYFAWRSPSLMMFEWAEVLGLDPEITWLRTAVAPAREHVPGWVLYSVPDAAWVYAFTVALHRLWHAQPSRERWLWLLLPTALGVGGELGQAVMAVEGTFDPLDVLCCAIAGGLVLARRAHSRRLESFAMGTS